MDMRVAAYSVITDDADRLLLAHWVEGRRSAWTLPGGGLEPGEDPEHAARREAQEESGYWIAIDELLGIHSRVIPAASRLDVDAAVPLRTLRIVYRAHVVGGRLRHEMDGSTDRAVWFTMPAVRKLRRVQLVDIALRMARLPASTGVDAAR
ncbi:MULTISPECIES: NUDIX hydrolase [Microbacterium]|uniref:NUDIX hydrolase n=1 Tax=Microbacterium TaxID=33882 RepID=UPI0027899CB7|nr:MULTISPECIES: NUDIX domain-containing protein [Microbacterium]MDQ1082340.1 8-oxo-dGTP diphosphatase [Microbacterium sp. SORGH_AS_0344]MDQ1168889.1 8-oxo-dGTP diphosphatase [Microbacterium proteolyticum]